MQIISKDETRRRKKCKWCGTIFTYKRCEIVQVYGENSFLKCPVCCNYLETSVFDKKIKE